MKKICLLILCVLLTANVANSANYCTQAGGTIVSNVPKPTSVGGTMTICRSGHYMNMWSAIAWCEAIGGRIINYNDLEISGMTVVNLSGYLSTDYFWAGIWTSEAAGFVIYSGSTRGARVPSASSKALCVMD